MDIRAVTGALEDAGFTIAPSSASPAAFGGVAAERSDAVEATQHGTTRVSVHRFAEPSGAIEAGSFLGSDRPRGLRYFAAGRALVVVEADDPELADAAYTVLTQAARKLT
jgi:hypothetical protein